jgi:hypothetical protein
MEVPVRAPYANSHAAVSFPLSCFALCDEMAHINSSIFAIKVRVHGSKPPSSQRAPQKRGRCGPQGLAGRVKSHHVGIESAILCHNPHSVTVLGRVRPNNANPRFCLHSGPCRLGPEQMLVRWPKSSEKLRLEEPEEETEATFAPSPNALPRRAQVAGDEGIQARPEPRVVGSWGWGGSSDGPRLEPHGSPPKPPC